MMETKDLLKLRQRRKRKQPAFVRKDTYIKAKVAANWRKPRGKHSPVRQSHKGRPKLVSPGYGSPKKVKHLHISGLEPTIIKNTKELENLDAQKQGVVVSKTVGDKKRSEILKMAMDKEISVLNVKEPQATIDKIKQEFDKRKQAKKKKLSQKEDKKKKAAEKKEEKKKTQDTKSQENKEAEVKKETSKAQTKKEDKSPLTDEEKEKKAREKTLIKKQ